MRSILLSVIFCLISSVSWSDSVSWADLVENPGDGLVYKKFLTMPFTGVVMASEDDPVKRSYKDGVKHGEWAEFDANGLVKTKSDYLEGKIQKIVGFKDGKETTEEKYKYYENGQLESKENYADGKEHGLHEGYYKNSQLFFTANYKDGELHGLHEEYYESGQLLFRLNYKDGEQHGLSERYYENGQLTFKLNYKDGKPHGLMEFFDKGGSVSSSYKFENGEMIIDLPQSNRNTHFRQR